MIDTPKYAVNPKSFRRAEAVEVGDGIPLEKASGFGSYIDREGLVDSLICSYTEISSTTTVDVSLRFSDVYLRVTGSDSPTITIAGALPPGRRLIVDARAITATTQCWIVVGGKTYRLFKEEGVIEFICTSAGFARPSPAFYGVRALSYINCDGSGAFDGTVNIGGVCSVLGDIDANSNLTIGGRLVPTAEPIIISGSVEQGEYVYLGRGSYMIPVNASVRIEMRIDNGWYEVEGGVSFNCASNALRLYGVPTGTGGARTWRALRY